MTLGSEQFTVATVKVSTTSPELSMFEAGARRLRQLGVGGGGGVNCQLAFTFSGADSVYACNGGQGRYVVVSGYPDGELVVKSLAVYLTQPRNRQPPSPSSPVSWIGVLRCRVHRVVNRVDDGAYCGHGMQPGYAAAHSSSQPTVTPSPACTCMSRRRRHRHQQ